MNSTLPAERIMIRSAKHWGDFNVLGKIGDYVYLVPRFHLGYQEHDDLKELALTEEIAEILGVRKLYRIYRPTLDYLVEGGDAAWQREPMPRPRRLRLRHWLEDRVYWWVTLPSRVLHGVTRHLF